MITPEDQEYEKVRKINWFSSCGDSCNSDLFVPVTKVAAIEGSISADYGALQEDLGGDLSEDIAISSSEAHSNWNKTVVHTNSKMADTFADIEERLIRLGFPKDAVHTVQWDIIHYFQEVAFREYLASRHYTEMMELYELGRFPCGYQGDYPKGMPMAY